MSQPPSPRRPRKSTPKQQQSKRQTSSDFKIEALRLRYQLFSRMIDGGRISLWIASTVLPLRVIAEITEDFAGETTELTATVSVTIAISIMMSVGWTMTVIRSQGRKREIDRLRSRNDALEKTLTQFRLSTEPDQQPEPA
ncbi:hypothetical protein [Micromonospora sp. NPDC047134]|uniref:hypothetical protein n=1 Tax=Micromonospora sp. NPDC047134 TaxID=3154340 RepID=UPI0033C5ACBD